MCWGGSDVVRSQRPRSTVRQLVLLVVVLAHGTHLPNMCMCMHMRTVNACTHLPKIGAVLASVAWKSSFVLLEVLPKVKPSGKKTPRCAS